MADLATLGIVAKMTGVNEAAIGLDNLSDSADKADVSAKKVGSSFTNLSGPLAALKVAFAGAVAAAGLGSFANLADEWSDLSSRVNLAAGSIDKGAAVMERLKQVANDTYSSLRLTTEGYIENATTLRALGKSTQDALDYTSALNNAMVISGAKAERAAQVQLALSRAMALGKLSGDQLNTVIANGGAITEALADELGVSVLELRKLGAEGKITGNVIYNALTKRAEEFAEKAGEMPATIGDAFQRIQNNVLSFVGGMDQASGASGALAEVLLSIADNVDRIIVTVGTAVTAFGVYYVGAMGAAAIATGTLSGALVVLRSALIKTGIGALVVIAGELVYQLLEARKATDGWGNAFIQVGGKLLSLWEGLKSAWSGLTLYMESLWYTMMAKIYSSTDTVISGIRRIMGISSEAAESLGMQYELMADTAGRRASDAFQDSADSIKNAFSGFEKSSPLASLSDDAETVSSAVDVASSNISKAAKKQKDAYSRIVTAAQERLAQMELEEQLVGKNGVAADVLRMKLDMLYEAKKKGLKLNGDQIKELNGLADAYGKVAERVAGLQLMEEARFERSQLLRSPIDAAIASDLRNAGIEMDSVAGQAYASFKKTTEQISIAKDEVKSFASGFISDILNGKSAIEALGGALQKLGDKLIDMALDQAINGLFGNLAGLFGGGGGGGIGALSGQFAASGGIGLFAKGGVSDKPAIFGEAGPEAAVPLPDGRSIPVTLNSGVGSEAVGETYAPVYNFSGTSEEFKQFKQFVLERDKQFNARAVNAVNKGSKKNAIRV